MLRHLNLFLCALGVTALSACGGGGGTSGSSSVPIAVSSPLSGPATSATSTLHLTPQAPSGALPAIGGFSGTIAFPPSALPATGATITITSTVIAGTTGAASSQRALSDTQTQTNYESQTFTSNVPVTVIPTITTTLPTSVNTATQSFFLVATGAPPNTDVFHDGPATVSGQTLTFLPPTTPVTLQANVTYTIVLFGVTATPVAFNDWPTYGFDNKRDGYNPNTSAWTPASIAQMHLGWQAAMNDFNTQTQPVVATNLAGHAAMLFVGGGSGKVQAFDGVTGGHVWTKQLGSGQFLCPDSPAFQFGVGGTAAYDSASRSLYIASAMNGSVNGPTQSLVYHLDAASGGLLGSVDISPSPFNAESNYPHTSLTLANGLVYAGTSSPCDSEPWRGRVAAVNTANMTVANTFFPVFNQGGPNNGGNGAYSGGGVWAWGGVSVDAAGNVYGDAGNAQTGGIQQPFAQPPNEQVGYGEHFFKLSSALAPLDANYPGLNFSNSSFDLDLSGTPVLYQPSLTCDTLAAMNGKSGQLFVYDTQSIGHGPLGRFQLSQDTFRGTNIGNPAFSPQTGLLYASASSGTGTLVPPGLVAISGCGSPKILWNTVFGPDSFSYQAAPQRSAPTVTAGGVIFAATACTPDGQGNCGASSDQSLHGAVWALNATTGALLNAGKPLFTTGDTIRMAPVVDGNWMWVLDNSGNLYGYTIDPTVRAAASKSAARSPLSVFHGKG